MHSNPSPSRAVLTHPGRFVLRVLKGFRANQGILLSGAVAYYTLLSVIPFFTLVLVGLSHFVDEKRLLSVIGQYLELVLPGDTASVVAQIATFLEQRDVLSWVLVGVMIFFSSMAFSVLENAITVIFAHRVEKRQRHFLTSAILPYLFILLLAFGFFVVSVIYTVLQAVEGLSIQLFGWVYLDGFSRFLLYLLGIGGEIILLTSIYMIMPVGHLSLRHALLGGVTAVLLWELTRRVLIWYFSTISLVNVVYGSLATAIVALLSLEIGSMILLLGAQVISEYERLGKELRAE
jgi:YihY family inner membrane protein